MAGLVAPPRLGAYSVTKYGVVALTEVLAAELAGACSKVGVAVVVRAIKRGDLYALTHPDWYGQVERRHEAIAAAFRQAADDGPV
jgi:NAD(P)-dependent dehydrogenase (short-subunit alcohol dehydrogenase family)